MMKNYLSILCKRNVFRLLFIYVIIFLNGIGSDIFSQNPKFYWYYYIVDNSGNVGTDIKLRYDHDGFPHVAYREVNGQYYVKYAKFNGSEWEISFVDPRDYLGYGKVSLDIDNFNSPHIIYHAEDGSEIRHAYFKEQKWVNDYVDISYIWRYEIDIKVDTLNKVHMCYERRYPDYPDKISYAVFENSVYSVGMIIDNNLSGKWNDMIIDNQNRPCVAYYDFGNVNLAFSYLDNEVWNKDIIDSSGIDILQGYYPSLAQTKDGTYYIVFQNQSESSLKMAIGGPDNWIVEKIVDISGWHEFSTPNPLVIDDNNNPYIAYYSLQDSSLNFAYKSENSWFIDKVDSNGSVGEWASMSLTPDGLPAIAYYDKTNGFLRLAIASLSPAQDTDGDGLLDYQENLLGTQIFDLDSDDDGLIDGVEDANQNGVVELSETNPVLFDSDIDGLSDGLELGVMNPVADPDGAGPIIGTDLALFQMDLDTNSITNPLNPDMDGDGLLDGDEDRNHNGRIDDWESNPILQDSDYDGLFDLLEFNIETNPLDVDTDDDGITEALEDINLNGLVDENETSPKKFDSDDDNLSDGLEKGLTIGVEDPDGAGPLKGTNLDIFIADSDTLVNSNPLLFDTDEDGLSDGEEDKNKNGAVDTDETNFLIIDTDGDGYSDGDEVYFLSEPLNISVVPQIDTLINEDYSKITTIPNEWTVVDDGNLEGPSYWFIQEKSLIQSTNIYSNPLSSSVDDPYRSGTFLLLNNYSLFNYKIEVDLQSRNNGEIGLIFNYLDENNFNCFSMNQEYSYIRLLDVVDGQSHLVNWKSFTYSSYQWYKIKIYSIGKDIKCYLNGKRIFSNSNSPLKSGLFAYYCWKNPVAMYDNLQIVSDTTITALPELKPRFIRKFVSSKEEGGMYLYWDIQRSSDVGYIEIQKKSNSKFDVIRQLNGKIDGEKIFKGKLEIKDFNIFDTFRLEVFSVSGELIESKSTNIQEIPDNSFYIYPNPISNKFNLSFQNKQPGRLIVKIYDILGRKILDTETMVSTSGKNVFSFEIQRLLRTKLSSGLYFFQFGFEDLSSGKIKFNQLKKVLVLN